MQTVVAQDFNPGTGRQISEFKDSIRLKSEFPVCQSFVEKSCLNSLKHPKRKKARKGKKEGGREKVEKKKNTAPN